MPPRLCAEIHDLRKDVIWARAHGRVTIEIWEPATRLLVPTFCQVADTLLEMMRFSPLADRWQEVTRDDAQRLLVAMLSRDLAHNRSIMPAHRARDLADRFLGLFPAGSTMLTSVSREMDLETWTGPAWNTVSKSAFDAGVVSVFGNLGGMLWVEDEV
jgi:hypothetical protein